MSLPSSPLPATTEDESPAGAIFDLVALAAGFPGHAATMLLDQRLVDRPNASVRVFRVYQPTPAHLHRCSDEQLLLLSGRATFWVGDPATAADYGPGSLMVFPRNTPHATPVILEHPLVFLAIDTPRRDPVDIHFLDPEDGSPQSFIAALPERP